MKIENGKVVLGDVLMKGQRTQASGNAADALKVGRLRLMNSSVLGKHSVLADVVKGSGAKAVLNFESDAPDTFTRGAFNDILATLQKTAGSDNSLKNVRITGVYGKNVSRFTAVA